MNIQNNIQTTNFCAQANPRKPLGVNIRISPQITRLTAIANLEISHNNAVAYTRNGEILSTNYNNIMTSLREAMTELAWSHKYNSTKGTWTRR